jgi:signal transduction histidine kinase
MGIRERCRKIHADVNWTSEQGSGTQVTVLMPLRLNAPES